MGKDLDFWLCILSDPVLGTVFENRPGYISSRTPQAAFLAHLRTSNMPVDTEMRGAEICGSLAVCTQQLRIYWGNIITKVPEFLRLYHLHQTH